MNVLRLELTKGLGRHLRAGHPWVFRKALAQVPRIPPGSVVDVVEHGKFVARGYYDPHSAIAVRILTLRPGDEINAGFFEKKVKQALQSRQTLLDLRDTDAFRLLHGEGDGLPGVVVDLYAGYAVLKLYSAGLKAFRPLIVEALKTSVPGLKGVIGRDEIGRDDADDEDGVASGQMLWGSPAPERISIRERGVAFWLDAYRGQKTGFFLDQRENRRLIRNLAKDREVLNCFCYTGGFSVNAALGGARSITSVDSDEDAIALAQENFTLNQIPLAPHDFLAADVFDALSAFREQERTFDLIVLDPPAFAKSQRNVDAAIDGYASLNRQALNLLRPGGLLATASCSARVTAEAFFNAIKEAAFKAGRDLALVEERYQPPDHPVRIQFREGRYLKFFVFQDVSPAATG
jgi:23S rRNA (cytosine1962-C5)-methyltransferase